MNNIYNVPTQLPTTELFETLLDRDNIVIERIVSQGQTTPPGKWYDQDRHEWVILLQGEAELSYEDNSRIKLSKGDYLFIRAHQKHRVEYTSVRPICIWLAIHFLE
jgi:cupin 2 domain-containing protein